MVSDVWIGIDQAASYMGVSKETIRNWIKRPTFQHIRLASCGNLNNQNLMHG